LERCSALDILLVVQLLFAISVLCLVALVMTCTAIMRHRRKDRRPAPSSTPPPQPSFTEHLYSAAEFGTPRSPRLVPHQNVQTITARKSWNAPSHSVEIHPAKNSRFSAKKKSPQSVRPSFGIASSHRHGRAHFNDYGDLSDPMPSRPHRAASGESL
jgi:hypothetical protein